MRGYKKLDTADTDLERKIEFFSMTDKFDEEILVPKIFRQFEKDWNLNPSKAYLSTRYGLSLYMLTKLIRICQKRKRAGLHLI